jgi:hypothetical protein
MRRGTCASIAASIVIAYLGLATMAEAVYIDDKRTFQVTGKFQTRASVKLQDPEGFSFPTDLAVGNMMQWRNLALITIDHDLDELAYDLDFLYPLKALKISASYRIVGRFLYDAVYDVGPQAFQDTKDRDKENINSFSHQYDLWECYLDLSRGPAFVRIGKQILAWGETDVFRLLDAINPLDNTFGGSFEDLDDRRIPLWMLRGTYDLGGLGPITSLMIEGFWVPGPWDARVAPIAPAGTPYSAPLPVETLQFARYTYPDKSMSSSRWGVRLNAQISRANITLAHYKTYPDTPATRTVLLREVPILLNPNEVVGVVSYEPIQITGGSLSFWERITDAVIRAEVAYFWHEPVFIPEANSATLYGPGIPLPPDLADEIGLDQIPINPQSGWLPKKNFLRYMIGFDKNIWIRALNRKNTFMFSAQYFGSWVQDFDDRMRLGIPLYPDRDRYPTVYELEQIFTFGTGTSFLNGALNPSFSLGYDVRGAFLVGARVNYIWGPLRFGVSYSAIAGNFTSFGVLRDRDQLSFIFSYLLN